MSALSETNNLVTDLNDLNAALNQFLDIADGGSADPADLEQSFQGLSQVMGQITALYGADLMAA